VEIKNAQHGAYLAATGGKTVACGTVTDTSAGGLPAVMARVTARLAPSLDQRSDGVGLRVVREMEREVAETGDKGGKGDKGTRKR
jgi:predicted N-acetyltransferase YhbS